MGEVQRPKKVVHVETYVKLLTKDLPLQQDVHFPQWVADEVRVCLWRIPGSTDFGAGFGTEFKVVPEAEFQCCLLENFLISCVDELAVEETD